MHQAPPWKNPCPGYTAHWFTFYGNFHYNIHVQNHCIILDPSHWKFPLQSKKTIPIQWVIRFTLFSTLHNLVNKVWQIVLYITKWHVSIVVNIYYIYKLLNYHGAFYAHFPQDCFIKSNHR